MKRRSWARRILLMILIGAVALLIFGGVVMLLWNNVLAQVVPISAITFWQALGILALSKILFGGFRGSWGSRPYYWKQGMMQKWNSMTPEEREKFKQQWQQRCGQWGYKSWKDQPDVKNSESEARSQQP